MCSIKKPFNVLNEKNKFFRLFSFNFGSIQFDELAF
jgi:hypothetical protein